jgi:DNA-binding transcriptional regulator YdaS (Cro superfamily)
MKTQDAIRLAGSGVQLAKLLGITQAAVAQWGENVPKAREWQLRLLKPEWFTE